MTTTAIVGAGAWGTALANLAALEHREVLLWCRDSDHAREMTFERENARRLPGVKLADGVTPIADLAALASARLVLMAVPTQSFRAVLTQLRAILPAGAVLVICAKGIERATGKFPVDIAHEILPENQVAVLSGPSFAVDVAKGLPTAVTLACLDETLARDIHAALAAPWFRLYHTRDIRGVELGGAAKNVIAIACGIAAGRKLGASAGAALVARGFAELARFGRAYGAKAETLMGLSGLGDLVLTCNAPQSRNFAFGFGLGSGIVSEGKGVVEGAFTAEILVRLAHERGIDMPIASAVDAVLRGMLDIDGAIDALLARPARGEAG